MFRLYHLFHVYRYVAVIFGTTDNSWYNTGKFSRATQQEAPVIGIVPVEVRVPERTANSRFSDLARARDQRHLAVFFQVASGTTLSSMNRND
jgi:hypothetical protein